MNIRQVNPKTLALEIETAYAAGQPLLVWGPPGIGKTAIFEQVCKKMGIGFIDVRLLLYEPPELKGMLYPSQDKDRAVYLHSELFPVADETGKPIDKKFEGGGIIFFDELTIAPIDMQKAALQIIQERRIGSKRIADGWVPMAAANRPEDKVGARRLVPTLENRFGHVEMDPNGHGEMAEKYLTAWVQWAIENDVAEEIISFIRTYPSELYKVSRNSPAWPSPRTYHKASIYANAALGTSAGEIERGQGRSRRRMTRQEALIAGVQTFCGMSVATKFQSYLTLYRKIYEVGVERMARERIYFTDGEYKVKDDWHAIIIAASTAVEAMIVREGNSNSERSVRKLIDGIFWLNGLGDKSAARDVMTRSAFNVTESFYNRYNITIYERITRLGKNKKLKGIDIDSVKKAVSEFITKTLAIKGRMNVL